MHADSLFGSQYVRLAAGAREAVAPYVGVRAADINELLIDLTDWPADVRVTPRKSSDGWLIAGDPVLLDASDAGLLLEGHGDGVVLVPWRSVRDLVALCSLSAAI